MTVSVILSGLFFVQRGKMFSWEISNYLNEHNYKTTFQDVRNIMQNSPQVIQFKMEELFSDIEGYGKYSLKTSDDCHWFIYIKNEG